jgi:hypothetical protein
VIGVIATAPLDARRGHVSSRYALPAIAIKTRIAAVAPMPNVSVDTGLESRK